MSNEKGFVLEKLVLNNSGIQEYLKSGEVQGLVLETAQGITNNLQGYRVESWPTRNIVFIYPETKEAQEDNFDNNTLLKAVG